MRDPLGRESRRRLDGQGRVLAEQSPGKKHYRQTIDEETGLLKELVNAVGRRWSFERNQAGSLTCVTSPNGTKYQLVVDDKGVLTTKVVE